MIIMGSKINMIIIKQIFKVFLALVLSGIILSIFCIVYCYSGIHITNKTGATDYKWETNQFKSIMTEGHAWMFLDEDGFNNTNLYDNVDILLMGSSHMEAINIKQESNVGELLNKRLPFNTYNIGMSGHQIYNIVNNYDSAIEFYKPSKYVVIETDKVNLDVNQMDFVVNNKYPKIVSYDSGLMYYMQKIPAIKTLYKKVQDWVSLSSNTGLDNVNSDILLVDKEYEEILYNFLNKINVKSKHANIKPIIFYHPAEKLEKSGDVIYATEQQYLDVFEKVCSDLDIIFIDMTSYFKTEYDNNYKMAHGFNNTHIGSGHLNENGHKIVANTISEKIKEMEGL